MTSRPPIIDCERPQAILQALLAASAQGLVGAPSTGVWRSGTTIARTVSSTGARATTTANGFVSYNPRIKSMAATDAATVTSQIGYSATATGEATHADNTTVPEVGVTSATGPTRRVAVSAADGSATVRGGQGQTKPVIVPKP